MKPFKQDTHRFMIHNYIIDAIMPSLSPTAFKILMCAVRQTMGWADAKSLTGRRERDRISYSQFMAKTGIRSPSTISRALNECLENNYLVRYKVGVHQGTGRPIYAYSLNTEYEAADATTESVVEIPETDPATTENGVAATTENGAATTESVAAATTESVVTKERKEASRKKEERKEASDLNGRIHENLRAMFPEAVYNDRIQPLVFAGENGRVSVRASPDAVGRQAMEWARLRLARTIAEAAGGAELVFEEVEQ